MGLFRHRRRFRNREFLSQEQGIYRVEQGMADTGDPGISRRHSGCSERKIRVFCFARKAHCVGQIVLAEMIGWDQVFAMCDYR